MADLKISTRLQYPPPSSKRSPAAAAKGDDHQLNLADLPDVVLVILFKMLPIPDRGRLACTCLRLYSIMQFPSVWTDVSIQLQATLTELQMDVSILGPKASSMVEKYGAYFQRATIAFPCTTMSQEVCDMLSKFTQRQIKITLTIKEGFYISDPRLSRIPLHPLDKPVYDVVDMMDRFSSSTSICFEFDHDYFDCDGLTRKFYCNPKPKQFCKILTELIFPEQWPEQKLAALYGLSPTPTAALVANFHALRRLKLSLHNVSEELLHELSDTSGRRSPLRSLVLQHVDRRSQMEAFPQLSSAAWRNLTSACPSLTVECYFACHHMPPLSQVIKPETPLIILNVTCRYSQSDRAHFDQVRDEHKNSLQVAHLSRRRGRKRCHALIGGT